MMYRTILLGALGAAIASPLPVWAQSTSDQGYGPYNSRTVVVNEGIPGPIREAPAIALPSIYGLNPCSLGAAAGVSTPLFGVSGAISTTDRDCQIRNTAAIAVSALDDKPLAREILCEIKEFRAAQLRLGQPCLVDKPAAPPVAAAPPSGTPVAAASTPSPSASIAVANKRDAPPVAAPPPPVAPAAAASMPAPSPSASIVVAASVATPTPPPHIPLSAPAFCHVPNLQLNLYPECET